MYIIPLVITASLSISTGLFGRLLNRNYVNKLIYFNFSLLSITAFLIFYEIVICKTNISITLFNWIQLYNININIGLNIDVLATIMIITISIISSIVHFYSIGYLSHTKHTNRFFSYLSLFTSLMLLLVTSDNYLGMFVGWEGIGLMSFLLISFWNTRIKANKSAIKAVLVNRVGDIAFMIAAALMISIFTSLDTTTINVLSNNLSQVEVNILTYSFNLLYVIGILIIIAAIVKSAQIGFHIWLADAMEAPTPVSALLHAATMVTAGVFLLLRSINIISINTSLFVYITLIGSITALLAGTIAVFQNDIKKIIAYSTCSQLGYMFISYGLKHYDVTLYHLSNHAYFKALLFLSSGNIIHALHNNQDIRRYGGLFLPVTYSFFLIGSVALMGFPFLAGFYSKDVIIELSYYISTTTAVIAYLFSVSASIMTGIYSTKIIYYTFITTPNSSKKVYINHHEADNNMLYPLIILAIFSITIGYLSKEVFLGVGKNLLVITEYQLLDIENISLIIKILPISLAILFSILYLSYRNNKSISLYKFTSLITLRYNFDNMIYSSTIYPINKIAYNITWKLLDKGILYVPVLSTNMAKILRDIIQVTQSKVLGDKLLILILLNIFMIILLVIGKVAEHGW